MTPGGAGRGGLGWAILAAALAVPGFLFYNWWSHLKADRDHSISAKAIKRADGGVFQTPPPSSGRLVNPMASSTSAPAGLPSAPAAGRAVLFTGATPAGMAAAAAPPARALPAPALPVPATPPAAPSPAAPSAVALSTGSTVVLSRDPMMSPLDLVRIQEEALAEEERKRALAAAREPHKHAGPKVQVSIDKRIELQGISSTADGDNFAMINDTRISVGDSFSVANYPGKVKVLKISESEVTFDYKGRRFKLRVNAE